VELVSPAAYRAGRLAARVEALDRRYVLAGITAVSWIVTVGFALHIKHNGWLYYSGGDGTYYWTTPWALAHHILPETIISYGLPVFVWPLVLIFGPSLLSALPVVVLAQMIFLPPIVVVGVYAIARRLGGQLFAYGAALLWALSPFIAYHFFYDRVRPMFKSIVLPSVLGLNNLSDYPSMVLTIVVAWLTLRAIDERRWNDVVLAGLFCGFLIGVKPANGFFVPAPIAAFLVARAWRQSLVFVGAMLPALITLALWKEAGLGKLPLFGATSLYTAAGPTAALGINTSTYLPFHWSIFTTNLSELREYGWSLRLAEWFPIAGLIGALRRGLPHAVLLGLWCFGYLVVKGGTNRASVYEWSWFRLVMPGFPAYVLLCCCIVFLIPGLGRRWRPAAKEYTRFRFSRGLIVAVAVFAVYPFLVVVTHGPGASNRVAIDPQNNFVPVASDLHVHVVQTPTGPSLRWSKPATGSTKVAYAVFRLHNTTGCPPAGVGRECFFVTPSIRLVHSLNFPAWQYGPGVYRVGLVAGPRITRNDGDMLLLSPPILVR
jgi:Dolichyl-phosphate-mannose-protein mannosyltransferase